MKRSMIALGIVTLVLAACSDQDADDRTGEAMQQQAPAATSPTTRHEAASMADKAVATGNKAWEATRETVSSATDKTGEVMTEVKEKAVQTYDQVKQKAGEVVQATKDKVGGMMNGSSSSAAPAQMPAMPQQMPTMPQQQ